MPSYPSSIKSLGTILGIALAIFFVASAVSAVWSPALDNPPTCDAGDPGCDTPLNTGSTAQTKAGNLTIGIVTASQFNDNVLPYVLNPSGTSVFDSVGIGGIASPSQKLDVAGGIHATGDICTDAAGGACLSTGMVETDPQVGAVTAGKWCVADGAAVQCTEDTPPDPYSGRLYGLCVRTTDGVCPAPDEPVELIPTYCLTGTCLCDPFVPDMWSIRIGSKDLGGGIKKEFWSCIYRP